MDIIKQTKLTKEEWETIEKPCNQNDKFILEFLNKSYDNVDEILYKNIPILSHLKINDKNCDIYIFEQLFLSHIQFIEKKYSSLFEKNKDFKNSNNVIKTLKNKKDKIKNATIIKVNSCLQKINKKIENIIDDIKNKRKINESDSNIIEYDLFIKSIKFLHYIKHKKKYNVKEISYIIKNKYVKYKDFTLNKYFISWFDNIMYFVNKNIKIEDILVNYSDFVIKNIDKDEYIELYQHQKELINFYKNKPKNEGSLILYTSPTGTGKTMTPICLVNNYKIIFICAARHVGITLANYMVSMGIKVGFAFGCSEMEDIRLHNNAVAEFTEKKYGKKIIRKPNHENGENVQILISDIQSYYYSMLYMNSFNKKEDIILYWDEPTIGLDYNDHEIHKDISNVIINNKLYNIILSSATLPETSDIQPFIDNFKSKFSDIPINVSTINSDIFLNNISIYDACGNTITPHYMWLDNSEKMELFIKYFNKNKKLQKYLDIEKCIEFIIDIHKFTNKDLFVDQYVINNILPNDLILIENKHITELYLYALSKTSQEYKNILDQHYKSKNKFNIKTKQQVFIVTNDAYTITGGPCLYLTNDYDKLTKVLFKSSNIPDEIINNLYKSIENNNKFMEIINKNIKLYEDIMEKELEKENKMSDGRIPPEAQKIKNTIESTQKKIKSLSLDNIYIPNFKEHFEKYNNKLNFSEYDLWSSNIDEQNMKKIIEINDLNHIFKIMLLIGVGVLHEDLPNEYREIMKELAKNKQLFMVIADDNYIYGTNYQFAHGYLGKDLVNMTQEKIIQSMGRIGRKSYNKKFSFRLRNDELIDKIYFKSDNNIEVQNINRLFVS